MLQKAGPKEAPHDPQDLVSVPNVRRNRGPSYPNFTQSPSREQPTTSSRYVRQPGVSSEPTTPPVEAESSKQKYHHQDDQ